MYLVESRYHADYILNQQNMIYAKKLSGVDADFTGFYERIKETTHGS